MVCTNCEIGIEPEETLDTTQAPELPKTKIEDTAFEMAEVPAEEKKEEKIPESAEVSGMLGLLTAGCLLTEEDKREACWKGIEPLESNKEKPLETVKRIIELEGAENVEKTIDALRGLVEEAKKELEDK